MNGTPGGLQSATPSRFGRGLAVILVLDAAMTFPLLGRLTLWNIDEGKIAEVSREMALTGDWVVPRIGEVPFSCYPPLAYWLMAASGTLFGWNEFAMRLPSALAGLALVAVVATLTRRLAGDKAGLAAAIVLATLPGFTVQERMCRADVLTLLFATLAFDRFLAWAEGPRRSRDLALMYLSVSLGVLAKGPIAIVMLGLGGLAWFLLRGEWRLLGAMKLWIGVPACLAIVLPWYLVVYSRLGASFLEQNLLLENINAFTKGYQQRRPFWFYVLDTPMVTAPWVFALVLSWRARGARSLGLGLAWFAGIFLFLTLSSAKRLSYVTYLCPGLAMSVGITLAAIDSEDPGLLRKSLFAMGAFLAAAAGTILVPRSWWTTRMDPVRDLLPMGIVAAAVAGVLVWAATWRRGPAAGAVALAVSMAIGIVLYGAIVAPRYDEEGRRSVSFCRRIAHAVPPGERIAFLRGEELEGSFHFYADSPLTPRNGEPGYYVLAQHQWSRLCEQGKKVEVKDRVADSRGRFKIFAQVTE